MRRTNRAKVLLPLALLLALAPAAPARAQTDARGALASLPDSQAVLYVNARRIVNDLLPRVMPAADYRKLLGDAQKGGFDVRQLDYAAVAIRFADPAPQRGGPRPTAGRPLPRLPGAGGSTPRRLPWPRASRRRSGA